MKSLILASAVAFSGVVSVSADTVLFNDTVKEGKLFANGTIEIDSDFQYPETETATLKFTSDREYANGGLEFYAAPLLIPAGESIIRFTVYTTDISAMNGISVGMDTGSQTFDDSNGSWTLDGEAGELAFFGSSTWHTIELDLSSNPNFVAGVSKLNGFVTFKTNADIPTVVFIGDIRIVSGS